MTNVNVKRVKLPTETELGDSDKVADTVVSLTVRVVDESAPLPALDDRSVVVIFNAPAELAVTLKINLQLCP